MKRHAVKARKAKKYGTTRSRVVGVIVLYMDKKRQDLVHRKHPHKEKTPYSKEYGAFIACLVAVFQVVLRVIRMLEHPHEYWTFASLLAFFNCSLLGDSQSAPIKRASFDSIFKIIMTVCFTMRRKRKMYIIECRPTLPETAQCTLSYSNFWLLQSLLQWACSSYL